MILVVGSGVAGLSCALAALAAGAEVELVTPGVLRPRADALGGGNTALAQGGVAAAVGPDDHAAEHLADTLTAGAGLSDAEASRFLTAAGARAVQDLIAAGLPVDRGADGAPALGLEGAHGRARILHSGGDRTGAALHAFLAERLLAAAARGGCTVTERTRAHALVREAGAVVGAVFVGPDGARQTRRADAVVLATGGYAGLFPGTTNHAGAQGDGIVLAARAGALLADLEFVQFHPTVLHASAEAQSGSGELISEAVRGAGAVLRDGSGTQFMLGRHPLADLAPRDVVSREIHRALRERGERTVWLDATGIERDGGPGSLAARFPGITAAVTAHGLDWARDPIPVAPAAHYTMGGVASDLDGRSSVPGLFVAGEVAATGVHGANRLASNSLLEGLVFGAAAGRAAAEFGGARGTWVPRGTGFLALAESAPRVAMSGAESSADAVADAVTDEAAGLAGGGTGSPARFPSDAKVRAAIAAGLGIEREAAGLRATASVCAEAARDSGVPGITEASVNAAVLGELMCVAAAERRESRGAHQRSDFPTTDPGAATRSGFTCEFGSAAASTPSSAPVPSRTHARSSPHPASPADSPAPAVRSLSSC